MKELLLLSLLLIAPQELPYPPLGDNPAVNWCSKTNPDDLICPEVTCLNSDVPLTTTNCPELAGICEEYRMHAAAIYLAGCIEANQAYKTYFENMMICLDLFDVCCDLNPTACMTGACYLALTECLDNADAYYWVQMTSAKIDLAVAISYNWQQYESEVRAACCGQYQ